MGGGIKDLVTAGGNVTLGVSEGAELIRSIQVDK